MIVRVSGGHAAQVRINSGHITAGDNIHNPFYVRGERVYVWVRRQDGQVAGRHGA